MDEPPRAGGKFHADGSLRAFPGCSIVCALPTAAPLFPALVGLQDRSRLESFSAKLALLPPASFHVTISDLVCEQRREPEVWSTRLALDAPLAEIDRALGDLLAPVHLPAKIQMRVTGLAGPGVTLHATLEPAAESVEAELRTLRDEISRRTGIEHPNHDRYAFHLSLAYRLAELDPAEQRALDRFVAGESARLVADACRVVLPRPYLALFPDMFSFPSVRDD